MGIQMRGNGSWTEAATEERAWVWGADWTDRGEGLEVINEQEGKEGGRSRKEGGKIRSWSQDMLSPRNP